MHETPMHGYAWRRLLCASAVLSFSHTANPADGSRTCSRPCQTNTDDCIFSAAARAFALSLALDDIFVQHTPSIEDTSLDLVPAYTGCLGPLLEQYLSSSNLDDFNLFLVVWIVLVPSLNSAAFPIRSSDIYWPLATSFRLSIFI